MQQWTKDDLSLLNMTNEVDYDQDGKYFELLNSYEMISRVGFLFRLFQKKFACCFIEVVFFQLIANSLKI